MWMMVFFDLPVGTKAERRAANQFRNFLKNDGYVMLQFSVYARTCRGTAGKDKHLGRLKNSLPRRGSVRCLTITDQQYARMSFLVGTKRTQEKASSDQMLLL
jgi:CRISPR-associated protein Cas2